jgi:hypothetical protein
MNFPKVFTKIIPDTNFDVFDARQKRKIRTVTNYMIN